VDRGRAVEHLALRLGIGVAGGLHAVQGHTLKFPGGFFVGSRSRNVPADPSMREQALGDERGLRHGGKVPTTSPRRIEEYQSERNTGAPGSSSAPERGGRWINQAAGVTQSLRPVFGQQKRSVEVDIARPLRQQQGRGHR